MCVCVCLCVHVCACVCVCVCVHVCVCVCVLQLLAASGPFQAWSPVSDGVLSSVRQPIGRSPAHRLPLLMGTSAEDGLIRRAAKIKVPLDQRRPLRSETAP